MDEKTPAADVPASPAPGPSRLVWDPYRGAFLGQAPERMHRHELTGDCPFCVDVVAGRVSPDVQRWIRPNDFPPLRPPLGECYILIYSREHDRTFADLSLDEVVGVIGLWRQVSAQLSARYASVMIWETSGEAIGQTQRHPHGQAYGLSIVPDTLQRELAAVERSLDAGEGCPFCAEARRESGAARAVIEGERWLAFVPEYARYSYQVHLYPRAHWPTITEMADDGQVAEELARSLSRIIRAYHRLFDAPMPYMLALHQHADPRFHLHLELLPVGRAPGKLKLAASAEAAWNFWLNDTLPEVAAATLRRLLNEEDR